MPHFSLHPSLSFRALTVGTALLLMSSLTACSGTTGSSAAPGASNTASATPQTPATEPSPGGHNDSGVSANDFPVNVTESKHPAAKPPGSGELRVTLLGTGSPIPSTDRSGFSMLIQAGEKNYMVDAGRGAIIRLIQAGVEAGRVDALFLTHYHSDHVISLDDLWMTGYLPAFGGREGPFELYGPEGVANIADNLRDAFQNDIDVRVADGELKRDTTQIQGARFQE